MCLVVCLHVCLCEVSDSLELELQAVVSCHVGDWELNPGPWQEQPVLIITEPSLFKNNHVIKSILTFRSVLETVNSSQVWWYMTLLPTIVRQRSTWSIRASARGWRDGSVVSNTCRRPRSGC